MAKGQNPKDAKNPNADLLVTGRPMPRIHLRIPPSSARYYRIHFTEDGFPAQRRPDGAILENPIYACYLIDEYVSQFLEEGERPALDAAVTVAEAALSRAGEFKGTTVFWYDERYNAARSAHRHYSGLTQAYFVQQLARLAQATGRATYFSRARACFESLLIPAVEGGVLREFPEGKGIEELPLAIPDLILNGWLSAVAVLAEDGSLIEKLGSAPFIRENLDLIEHLLPLYDVPRLVNSRYSLAGHFLVRLRFPAQRTLRLREPRIDLSEGWSFPLALDAPTSWTAYLSSAELEPSPDGSYAAHQGTVRFNVVLSRLGRTNALRFLARADAPCRVEADAFLGRYSPLHSAPIDRDWAPVATLEIGPEEREYSIAFRHPLTELIGYPTNFMKKFDGVHRNVYHPIHINRLANLHAYEPRPVFAEFIRRWTGYVAKWPQTERYRAFGDIDYSQYITVSYRGLIGDEAANEAS